MSNLHKVLFRACPTNPLNGGGGGDLGVNIKKKAFTTALKENFKGFFQAFVKVN